MSQRAYGRIGQRDEIDFQNLQRREIGRKFDQAIGAHPLLLRRHTFQDQYAQRRQPPEITQTRKQESAAYEISNNQRLQLRMKAEKLIKNFPRN